MELFLHSEFSNNFITQGPVVRTPISAEPRVKFNRGFFSFVQFKKDFLG